MSAAAAAVSDVGQEVIGEFTGADQAREALKGQRRARQTQERMLDRQLEFLREGRETARADLQPFREAGVGALGQFQELLRDPSALAEDPGLQFLQRQGQRQVETSGAARGTQLSGRQLGDLQERGQNIASTFRSQILGEIGQLINVGQSAAAGQASTAFRGAGAGATAVGGALGNIADIQQQSGQIRGAQEGAETDLLVGGLKTLGSSLGLPA